MEVRPIRGYTHGTFVGACRFFMSAWSLHRTMATAPGTPSRAPVGNTAGEGLGGPAMSSRPSKTRQALCTLPKAQGRLKAVQ